MTHKQKKENKVSKKVTSKQVVAIVGVTVLIFMYLLALIAAIFDNSSSMLFFRACVIATFTIPLLIWVYIWMYGKLTQKHTIADLDIGGVPEASAKKDEDTK